MIIINPKIRCQLHSRPEIIQFIQPCCKINHVAVCLTAETVETLIHLHAWVFIIMEWAARHAVPVHPDAVHLRRLPCCHIFLYCFKYIHTVPFRNKKASAISAKKSKCFKFPYLFLLPVLSHPCAPCVPGSPGLLLFSPLQACP